jgi:cytochrome c oxidase assembly protein subunit 15
MRRAGQVLLALSALQLLTGVSNVVFEWPLIAAVLHTGGAAAMVVSLTWALGISRSGIFVVSDVPPNAVHPSLDSRPAA